ncbi:gamma carbonic anhydrase family protein [Clostridium sp. Marseille-Q7071]
MIKSFKGINPNIHDSCFIAENAAIIGNVEIAENSNIWYGTVLRGDMDYLKVGKNTNIQDNSTVHNDYNTPTKIGDNVTIGHNSIIHGCSIGNNVLIGMGSIILNNSEIGENTIIGAGSLVTQGKKIPSGVLCMGSPAKVVRELTKEEIEHIKKSAEGYVQMGMEHKQG